MELSWQCQEAGTPAKATQQCLQVGETRHQDTRLKVGFEQQEQGGLGVLEGSLVGDRSQSMTECLYSIIQIKLPENVFLVT